MNSPRTRSGPQQRRRAALNLRFRASVTFPYARAQVPSSVGGGLAAGGLTLLAEEGVRALKIERLCQQAGVTRGSFYWHFQDMDSYRAALLESWNTFLEKDRQSLAELDALPPRDRLSAMMTALTSPAHWTLERAMREWARTDPAAAANVRAADRRLVRSVGAA